MHYDSGTNVRAVYSIAFAWLVPLVAVASLGCNLDILDGLETPCSRANLDCDDGNPCTRDYCANYLDLFGTGVSGPMCEHEPANDGAACSYAGISGECRDGLCGREELCEGVVCQDDDLCTNNECAWNGKCVFPPVQCGDGNECTEDRCDPLTGACDFTTPAGDGTWCFADSSAPPEVGGCEAGVCLGPCDPGSSEESACPVEFPLGTLACCPGNDTCVLSCPAERQTRTSASSR